MCYVDAIILIVMCLFGLAAAILAGSFMPSLKGGVCIGIIVAFATSAFFVYLLFVVSNHHIDYYMLEDKCSVYEDVRSMDSIGKIHLIETTEIQDKFITRVVVEAKNNWDYRKVDSQMKDLGYFPEISDLLRKNPETFVYCDNYMTEKESEFLTDMIDESFFRETK